MIKIADFIDRVIKICVSVQAKSGKNIKDFMSLLEQEEGIKTLAKEVDVYKYNKS